MAVVNRGNIREGPHFLKMFLFSFEYSRKGVENKIETDVQIIETRRVVYAFIRIQSSFHG